MDHDEGTLKANAPMAGGEGEAGCQGSDGLILPDPRPVVKPNYGSVSAACDSCGALTRVPLMLCRGMHSWPCGECGWPAWLPSKCWPEEPTPEDWERITLAHEIWTSDATDYWHDRIELYQTTSDRCTCPDYTIRVVARRERTTCKHIVAHEALERWDGHNG
jgi:hypothetical protein